jgi:hypothetical protein
MPKLKNSQPKTCCCKIANLFAQNVLEHTYEQLQSKNYFTLANARHKEGTPASLVIPRAKPTQIHNPDYATARRA